MKAPSVFLRGEIAPEDVRKICLWLQNPHITRFLHEEAGAVAQLEALLAQVPAPLLTLRLSREGRFFMVCCGEQAVGFVRLWEYSRGCYELVIVIGSESLWGRGYGRAAMAAVQKQVFFDWRARRLTAKILRGNLRSEGLMRGVGLCLAEKGPTLSRYEMTLEGYLTYLSPPEEEEEFGT